MSPFQGQRRNCHVIWLKTAVRFFCQTTSGEACAHDKRTRREKERPERAVSSLPRATPWVSVYKRLRPVRAKVWANGWLLLLPLQGVGNGDMVPRALPWAMNLLGFQPAQGRLYRRERPERAASSQPRATPWVSVHKSLRPVRAKVWANGWLLLLPLQVGCSKSRKISARF